MAEVSFSPLTSAQITAQLDVFKGGTGNIGLKGLVPAPDVGAGSGAKVLLDNGGWGTVSGGGRSDAAPVSVLASAGSAIDVLTSERVIITMDADMFNITNLVDPTVDGMKLRLIFIKLPVLKLATTSATKFADTNTNVQPNPLLLAQASTRDEHDYAWNATIGKWIYMGFNLGG